MTLPVSGNPIGIKDINVELGLSPTYSSSLQFLNGFLAAPQSAPSMSSFYGLTYFALITGNCANGNCTASPNNCQYQCTNCSQCNAINCTTTGSTLLQNNCNCAGPTFNCALVTNQYYNCNCACDCDCACNCPPPPPVDCACAPPPPVDCACACNCSKIVCAKLHEEGLLDERVWAADQIYGRYLRKSDRRAYRGYIRWARIVTAWMDGRGPSFMIWERNKEKRATKQANITLKMASLIGIPWANHMAFLMGAAKNDDVMGRIMMTLGKPICRWVDYVPRVSRFHHSLVALYTIWTLAYSIYAAAYVGSKCIEIKNKLKMAFAKLRKQELK